MSDLSNLKPYNRQIGFVIYWDYMLNLVKAEVPNGSMVQLIYGIYNSAGMALIEPRCVRPSPVLNSTHPLFTQCIFSESHRVRSERLNGDPSNLLIVEI
jgi:hypothetical protein